jgi:hypothetical protein
LLSGQHPIVATGLLGLSLLAGLLVSALFLRFLVGRLLGSHEGFLKALVTAYLGGTAMVALDALMGGPLPARLVAELVVVVGVHAVVVGALFGMSFRGAVRVALPAALLTFLYVRGAFAVAGGVIGN